MKLLDMLERSVERVVRSPIDSLFRQDIQPAEIERHLERAMRDNGRRASGAAIMPNRYSVQLAEDDFATVKPYLGSLTRRLESWAADRVDSLDGTVLDRIQVEIVSAPEVRRRHPRIDARISDISGLPARPPHRPDPAQGEHTQRFNVVRRKSHVVLRVLTGKQAGNSFDIQAGQSIVGRSHNADIRIDAPEVSRQHLRLDRTGATITVTDLGSTNGTRVNGEQVSSAVVRNGDEILIGTQALRIVDES